MVSSLSSVKLSVAKKLARLKVLWVSWNLRGFVLGSLILQTILILLAPFRKKTSNGLVIVSIWMAYLVAEYVANQAIGLVPRYTSEMRVRHSNIEIEEPHPDLLVFWSPFLLLHLGGPDTITALALEDNELWIRSLLQLGAQVAATGRVFFQSLPSNVLWEATALMFLAGIIKYVERVLSLFHASSTNFKSSVILGLGENYNALMKIYVENMDRPGGNQTRYYSEFDEAEIVVLSEVDMVRDAYAFFQVYKGLYGDSIFGFRHRLESRAYFLVRNDEQAFKVIEIELNLTYEIFYTKMMVIRRTVGKCLRPISVGCQVLSLVIWFFTSKKSFHPYDVRLTYTLLIGAIAMDGFAFMRLMLSDWQIGDLLKRKRSSTTTKTTPLAVRMFEYFVLSFKERTWGMGKEEASLGPWLKRIFFRRWSESISQFSLVNLCVDTWGETMDKFLDSIGVKDILDKVIYVSNKWFTDDLRGFIFRELKYKSKMAIHPTDADVVCSSRGDWVLRSMATSIDYDLSTFYPWTSGMDYDQSLFIWHIATEISYEEEDNNININPQDVNWCKKTTHLIWNLISNSFNKLRSACCFTKQENSTIPPPADRTLDEKDYREFCKTLSDYMMYLLIMQPKMMSPVSGISDVRYRHTCEELKKIFRHGSPLYDQLTICGGEARHASSLPSNLSKKTRHNEACKRFFTLAQLMRVPPSVIKGDRRQTVMRNTYGLLRKLDDLKEKTNRKWEVTAKVWVELLGYASMHINASDHAAQLKQGGELVTLVWLLMVHLGLMKKRFTS